MATRQGSARRRGLLHLAVVGAVAASAVVALALRLDPNPTPPGTSWQGNEAVGVILTEVVAANAGGLADADGDHPDWIEVANPTDRVIDLAGWSLSDDDRRLHRWQFPAVTLAPGEHRVVFASGKDRRGADGELHTNFALDRAGEPVLLVEPDTGSVADLLAPVALPPEVSFGRSAADPTRWCYFFTPTPGEANSTACFDDLDLGRPRFSHAAGYLDGPFELAIEADPEHGPVYYTLDGSVPDPDRNPDATLRYDRPVRIDPAGPPPPGQDTPLSAIDTTIPGVVPRWAPIDAPVQRVAVVRARVRDGAEHTATYLVGPDMAARSLPVVSILAEPEQLFGHEHGIYVAGATAEAAGSVAGAGPVPDWELPANYLQRGREWERPAQHDLARPIVLEFCEVDLDCAYRTGVGLRIHGGFSRSRPQKSLRLYAREEYGEEAFTHELFDGAAPQGHRRLLLRNSGNDFHGLMFLDAYLQSLYGHLDADTQASRPVVVFLNGEYWGIHNLRERFDRFYVEVVHGIDADRVVMLDEDLAVTDGPPDGAEPYLDLLSELATASHLDERLRARVTAELDLDSLFDMVLAHAFVGNWDWPGNNVRLWRAAPPEGTDGPTDGVGDGRWRWMIFDLDHMGERRGRYNVDYDVFADRMAPSDDPEVEGGYPLLFHRLMQDQALRARFLNRFADQLSTTLRPERTRPALAAMAERYRDELPLHRARWWPQEPDASRWEADLAGLDRFLQARPDRQFDHLVDAFGLDGTAALTVLTDPSGGRVRVNRVLVDPSTPGVDRADRFTGRYFLGVPVPVVAEPADDHRFVAWEDASGRQVSTDPELELTLSGPLDLTAVFAPR